MYSHVSPICVINLFLKQILRMNHLHQIQLILYNIYIEHLLIARPYIGEISCDTYTFVLG